MVALGRTPDHSSWGMAGISPAMVVHRLATVPLSASPAWLAFVRSIESLAG